jgi:hypothetical protein
MLEDRFLVWRFNRGEPSALCEIYEKYRAPLLKVGAALLNDRSGAEDVLDDVFVEFARTSGRFRLTGSLKGYLSSASPTAPVTGIALGDVTARSASMTRTLVRHGQGISRTQPSIAI